MIFNKIYSLSILLLLFAFMATQSATAELIPRVGDYRFTYDNLLLPESEAMGLLGGSYLLRKKEWYGGFGTYSAVSGWRGGFYTIGLEFGRFIPLTPSWRFNMNGFVGGGGGGAAPQGGGLMLRQSLTLEYLAGGNAFSFGLSGVQFPNGDINSEQLTFGISRNFESLFAPADYDLKTLDDDILSLLNVGKRVGVERYHLSAQLKQYYPSSDSLMTNGQKHPNRMRLLGAKLRYFPMNSFYTGLATYGANGGGVDGFAQLGLIAGMEYPLTSSFVSNFELQLGSAGGGRVETGGGFIVAAELGLNLLLSRSFSLGVDTGYITAPDGKFSAASYALTMGYKYDVLGISNSSTPMLAGINFQRYDWRMRLLQQRYAPDNDSQLRKSLSTISASEAIDLVGLSMDLFLTPKLYLSGQAMGAYNGGAGGYAVGMFGLGYQQDVTSALSLGAEVAAGSAGGGGLAVESGLVGHYYLTAEYRVAKHVGVGASVGRFKSLEGPLATNLVQLSLSYRFSDIAITTD